MPSGWVSHRLGGSPKCISALSLPSGTVGAPSKPDNDATRGRTRPTVPPPDPAAMGTWKFFRASVDGRPVFKKEFDKLPDQARAALIVLMQRYLVGASPQGASNRFVATFWSCDGMRRTTTSGYCSSAGASIP